MKNQKKKNNKKYTSKKNDKIIIKKIEKEYYKLDKKDPDYDKKLQKVIELVKSLKHDKSKLYVGKVIDRNLIDYDVIKSMNRNSNKFKALDINPQKKISQELRREESISPWLVKKYRETVLKCELGENVPNEELKRRAEILKRMEEKNEGISKNIKDFRLIDEKYINLLGEDNISYLGLFERQTKQLLNLSDKELQVLKKAYDNYFKQNNTNDWYTLLQQLLNGIEWANEVQKAINDNFIINGLMTEEEAPQSFFDEMDLDNIDLDNLTKVLTTNYPTFLKEKILHEMQQGKIEDIITIFNKFLKEHGMDFSDKSDSSENSFCDILENNTRIGRMPSSRTGSYAVEEGEDFYSVNHGSIGKELEIERKIKKEKKYDPLNDILERREKEKEDSGWYDFLDDLINIDELTPEQLKEAVLFKAFGIPLYEDKEDNFTLDQRKGVRWLLKVYGEDIDKLEDSKYKKIIQIMQMLDEIDDPRDLKEIYKSLKGFRHIDIIQFESELKKEYLKLYNKEIIDPKNLEKNEDGLYDAGTDFCAIITVVGAYSKNQPCDNRKEAWNRKSLASQHFCTSCIGNNMIACCEIEDGQVCYGFSNLDKNSFLLAGTSDIFSSNAKDFGVWNKDIGYSRKIKFLSPKNLLRQTSRAYNELDFRRNQHGAQNDPSYIVVFKIDGKYKNLEESKKASEDFGKLPIVTVDVNKCLETEKEKIVKLKAEYMKTNDIEILREIYTSVCMNKKTIKTFWGKEDYPDKEFWEKFDLKRIEKQIKKQEKDSKITSNILEKVYQNYRKEKVIEEIKNLDEGDLNR